MVEAEVPPGTPSTPHPTTTRRNLKLRVLYPSASVIVVTLSRPDFLRTCLTRISAQTVTPLEVIVVDASPDERTRNLLASEFPDVEYVQNPRGAGSTATSRNLGFRQAQGEIIAFIDDDAFADPDWLEELLKVYAANPGAGGVGGRARNGIAREEAIGCEEIGRLRADGTLSGNFAADPGRIVAVDHLLGANMSFRSEALVAIGGIHDGYPGTCLCEETDIAFRVRESGWGLYFTPHSCVDHVAAPYPKGRRFDVRYAYYAHRNHVVLLSRTNGGYRSRRFYRYIGFSLQRSLSEIARAVKALREAGSTDFRTSARTFAGASSRAVVVATGTAVGLVAGARQRQLDRRSR